MRILALLAMGSSLVLTSGSAGAADASDLPLRKAGHWEITTVMDEGRGPREQVLTMCIDAEMERKTAQASKKTHEENCSTYEVKTSNGVTTTDAECVFNERNVNSHTEMSGDFEKVFQVKINSTTSGTARGQSISIKRTITQNGKYLGEDCNGLQAGEAMGTDGKKIMVQ